MTSDPRFDVVLYGPTGVTGREVARYLSTRAPELGLRWAVAGRDRDRIEATLTQVGAEPAEIMLADSEDPESIDAMVEAAGCVANLVGPYARYGEPVYAACARLGRHEVDPTGETDWIRRMITTYDEQATASGAVIVPTAGFESTPFDLGALFAAHALHERTGDPVVDIDIAVSTSSSVPTTGLADAVSGGTAASLFDVIRRGDARVATDPYLLDTPGSRARGSYDLRPRKHARTRAWLAPMVPSPFLNPPVVHRSAALLRDSGDTIYAEDFSYREGTATASMVPPALAGATAAAFSLVSAGSGWLQRASTKVRGAVVDALEAGAPAPGEGPAQDTLDAWSYRLDIRATDARGGTQDAAVEAQGHPGYKSTSMMLGEAALALADVDAPVPDGAGFLTPATALGLGVLDRFRAAGVSFTLVGG